LYGVKAALPKSGGVMVLAVKDGAGLREAAAAAAAPDAFGASAVRVACNPLEEADDSGGGGGSSGGGGGGGDCDRDCNGPAAKRAKLTPPPLTDAPFHVAFHGVSRNGGVVAARTGPGGLPLDFFHPAAWEKHVVAKLCKGPLVGQCRYPY
jgi:hypothetical protein